MRYVRYLAANIDISSNNERVVSSTGSHKIYRPTANDRKKSKRKFALPLNLTLRSRLCERHHHVICRLQDIRFSTV